MSQIVLPGDPIDTTGDTVLILGPGLLQIDDQTIATTSGTLHNNSSANQYWVVGNRRRYIASEGEPILGVIVGRHAEGYRVDIGSAHDALLPLLAFEGATKRNKPNLAIGALVYGRVVVANSYMDPEIECVNSKTGKSDGYGEIEGGFMFRCSLGLCRRLIGEEAPVLRALGSGLSFEVAVGVNGRVWVKAEAPELTICIANAIKNSEFLTTLQCQQMVKELLDRQ